MEILVCVKRVPQVGGKIVVTADGQDVDTRMAGLAMSPHEECAVEEAIQITERLGGAVSVLTLGPPDAADTGDYQVGVRVAHALGWPCVTGIKGIEITDGTIRARREYRGAEELFEFGLPAVISVKEGINLPRYPSLPGRLRAKRAAIETHQPQWRPDGLRKQALRVPETEKRQAAVLGTGVDAVPALVALLDELGVLP